MIMTRSQASRNGRTDHVEAGTFSDEDSNDSMPDIPSRNSYADSIVEAMRSWERDHENYRIEQRFMEMNRQIGELTSIVRALTEKISNSKEGNNQDVLNSETSTRSDSYCFFTSVSLDLFVAL